MIKKFKKINREFDINIDVDLSNIQGKRIFKFTFYIGDEVYRGKGETGNTSLWFPITESRGIKYIPEYKKYDGILKNVKYFKSLDSDIFPKINDILIQDDHMFIDMEHVKYKDMELLKNEIDFVPEKDRKFVKKNIYLPPRFTKSCLSFF